MTVWRRAVCALALLALLCGCGCASVRAEATKVNVSVEVSCPNAEKKLSWRVAGISNSAWSTCSTTPEGAGSSESDVLSSFLCLLAGSLYNDPDRNPGSSVECTSSPAAGGTKKVAFTMECTTDENSALHKRSKDETATINATGNPLAEPGNCVLRTPSQNAALQHEGAPLGVRSPAAGEQHPQPPEGSAASSTQAAEKAADGPGTTQTPSTPQFRSGTPKSAPSAAAPAATAVEGATTTTTTSGPSAGSHAKSNADSSDTLTTAWVRAPLMLLLTAALACAAG
ncbi:mucin-like glycoprotein [Trypanosoma conorhini]|uniref:Mucin-like glycoprotein n=1 Tax=Trypanosoma conorhini TaxID=83891 RepID=A0A422N139_9TRYP|nr:mucin-like glycoprotein [Trypanosoma conorhini]RNE99177.1 mucin-like glycoprotein [Trypanosoma conorhini]